MIDQTGGTIADMNPYRYRGYRYDVETGYYYLQSRYYDPVIGRFMSSDGLLGETGNLLTHNMYAYANNNPVMNVDPNGDFAISAIIIGAILGFAAVYIQDVMYELKDGFEWSDLNTFKENGWKYLDATLGGALGGLGEGIGTTMLAGGLGNAVSGLFSGEINSLSSASLHFGMGMVTSGLSYGLSKCITSSLASKKFQYFGNIKQKYKNQF